MWAFRGTVKYALATIHATNWTCSGLYTILIKIASVIIPGASLSNLLVIQFDPFAHFFGRADVFARNAFDLLNIVSSNLQLQRPCMLNTFIV